METSSQRNQSLQIPALPSYTIMFDNTTLHRIGNTISVGGTILSIAGALCNNILLNHLLAMQIWMASNLVLLCYFIGVYFEYWNGKLSTSAIIVMYLLFASSNLYGLLL